MFLWEVEIHFSISLRMSKQCSKCSTAYSKMSKCIILKRDLSAAHCEQINVYQPCSYTFEILHSMHHLLIIVFLSHTIISSFFFSAEAHHSLCPLSLYPHSSIFPFILAAPWVGFRLYLKGPFDLRCRFSLSTVCDLALTLSVTV